MLSSSPSAQAEIDRIFGDTDKRAIVARLRETERVEEFPGPGRRLQFSTTAEFLHRFKRNSST